VIDIILDKGLVIDAYVRVSLVGIELLTIDARIVIASVDTYLRFAEASAASTSPKAVILWGCPSSWKAFRKAANRSNAEGTVEGLKGRRSASAATTMTSAQSWRPGAADTCRDKRRLERLAAMATDEHTRARGGGQGTGARRGDARPARLVRGLPLPHPQA
jgi:gas vesicle structural protein